MRTELSDPVILCWIRQPSRRVLCLHAHTCDSTVPLNSRQADFGQHPQSCVAESSRTQRASPIASPLNPGQSRLRIM